MVRRRRSRSIRSYRPLKTMKYSNETVSAGATWNTDNIDATQTYPFPIVSPSDVLGTRKVKNFTIRASLQSGGVPGCCLCALIYLPEGLSASGAFGLRSGTGGTSSAALTFYEPSQNVIASWVMAYNENPPITVTSRLARNLNSGDSIWLLIRPMNGLNTNQQLQFNYTCNFALGYN